MGLLSFLFIVLGCTLLFDGYNFAQVVKKAEERLSAECLQFEETPKHSLYGYNNHIVNGVYLEDCRTLCISQDMFLCASFEYSDDSGTCYLSAEDMYSQPRAFDVNMNTDYYQRYCANRLPGSTSVPTTSTQRVPSTVSTQSTRVVPSTQESSTQSTRVVPSTPESTTIASTQRETTTPRPSTAPSTTTHRSTTTVRSTQSSTWHEYSTTTPSTISEASIYWGTTTPTADTSDTLSPEFYGVSFLELIKPSHIQRLCEVTIEFSPGTENGLVIYLADQSEEFLSLAMVDGYLEFRFDTGSGPAILKSHEPLALNTSHYVVASRLNRQGRLQVGGQESVSGESPEGTEILDVMAGVFLGFVPPELYDQMIQQTETLLGFAGCVHALMIEGLGSRLQYDLALTTSEDIIQRDGVGVCGDHEVEVSACDLHPCYHGTCLPEQPESYQCVCEIGYTGKNCEGLLIIDVLDEVQVSQNASGMAWINCIGRSTLDNTDWTIKWYHNEAEIQDSNTESTDFVKTEYETDLLGAEKLFVAQLYFPHINELNQAVLSGNYTCELVTSLEPHLRKVIEVNF